MICNMVCEVIYSLLNSSLGPVSRKSRKLFGPEKPFVKLRPAYSAKLVFSYVEKGIKIKITAKFRASRRLTFEDTKRIMSPEMHPKCFGTFEKQTPGSKEALGTKSINRPYACLRQNLKFRHQASLLFSYFPSHGNSFDSHKIGNSLRQFIKGLRVKARLARETRHGLT